MEIAFGRAGVNVNLFRLEARVFSAVVPPVAGGQGPPWCGRPHTWGLSLTYVSVPSHVSSPASATVVCVGLCVCVCVCPYLRCVCVGVSVRMCFGCSYGGGSFSFPFLSFSLSFSYVFMLFGFLTSVRHFVLMYEKCHTNK